MAESNEPAIIPIRFDTTGAKADLAELRQEAQRGVTVPTGNAGPVSGSQVIPAGRGGGTTPIPGPSPIGGPIQATYQNAASAAFARGDDAAVARIVAQAAGAGVNVAAPAATGDLDPSLVGWRQSLTWGLRQRAAQVGAIPGGARGAFGPPLPPGWGQPGGTTGPGGFGPPVPANFVSPVPVGPSYQLGRQQLGPSLPPGFVPWGQPGGAAGPGGYGPTVPYGFVPSAPLNPQQAAQWFRDNDQPGIVSRVANMRVGRGIMFGLIAADRAANALRLSENYHTQMLMAGNDPAAQAEATMKYREELTTSIPFVGQIAGEIADPGGFQRAIMQTQLAAGTASQARMQQRMQSAESLYRLQGQVRIGAAGGGTSSVLMAGQVEREQADREALRVREQQRVADEAQIGANEAARTAAREAKVYDALRNTYGTPIALATKYFAEKAGIPFGGDAEDQATRNETTTLANSREAAYKSALAANEARQRQAAHNATEAAQSSAAVAALQAQGQTYGAGMEEIEGLFKSGKIDATERLGRANALYAGTAREATIAHAEISGMTYASSLARIGQPLAAAQAAIDARYGTLFSKLDQTPNAPGTAQARQDLREAQSEEYSRAQQGEDQRLIMIQAAHEAAVFGLARSPIGAELRAIQGRRDAALVDIPEDSAEYKRINQAAADDARQALQQRADQTQLININQSTRGEQLNALLARNPMGAETAGIVGRARTEELQDRILGFNAQADNARQLGIKALKLERQEYLDAFRGVVVSKDFAFGLRKQDVENPAQIVQGINDAIKGLGTAGTAPGTDVPQLLKDINQTISDAVGKIAAMLTN